MPDSGFLFRMLACLCIQCTVIDWALKNLIFFSVKIFIKFFFSKRYNITVEKQYYFFILLPLPSPSPSPSPSRWQQAKKSSNRKLKQRANVKEEKRKKQKSIAGYDEFERISQSTMVPPCHPPVAPCRSWHYLTQQMELRRCSSIICSYRDDTCETCFGQERCNSGERRFQIWAWDCSRPRPRYTVRAVELPRLSALAVKSIPKLVQPTSQCGEQSEYAYTPFTEECLARGGGKWHCHPLVLVISDIQWGWMKVTRHPADWPVFYSMIPSSRMSCWWWHTMYRGTKVLTFYWW